MPERAPIFMTEQGWKIHGVQAWLDPSHPVHTAVLSHAHGDHAIEGHRRVFCTKDTARLLTVRYRKFAWEVIVCEWNIPVEIDGVEFTFHPAGHMLGAAQISWTFQGEKVLYTGDFHPAENPTCNPYLQVNCDILITETTFAQPGKKHPDPSTVLIEQLSDPDLNYVIGAYVLGKSQRVNNLLTTYLPHLQVMLHAKIIPYHHAYLAAGFSPGEWIPYNKQHFKRSRSIVYIAPPQVMLHMPPVTYAKRGFASGWLERQEGYELQLPISDHADWYDLVTTIEQSGAKQIYTLHGDGDQLRLHFENKIPVAALEE